MPLGPTLSHHEERQLALDVHRLVTHYPLSDVLIYLRAALEARFGTPSIEYRTVDEAYARYERSFDVSF